MWRAAAFVLLFGLKGKPPGERLLLWKLSPLARIPEIGLEVKGKPDEFCTNVQIARQPVAIQNTNTRSCQAMVRWWCHSPVVLLEKSLNGRGQAVFPLQAPIRGVPQT
jgi:hypothetical protein